MNYPAISSNTLFHFTDKREYVISILENNFRPQIRKEEFGSLIPNHPTPEICAHAFPRVCFCDLPLSSTSKHLNKYGKYGVGLKKSWGIKNGLNPILYVQRESRLWKDVLESNQEMLNETNLSDSVFKGITTLQFFIKPYEGSDSYRFYDEREWRFVPRRLEGEKQENYKIQNIYDPENIYGDSECEYYNFNVSYYDTLNKEQIDELSSSLPESATLKFTPDDIRYLIVEKETEILEMSREVSRIKEKYTDDQKEVLKTRIISAEQIREDF